MNLQCIKFCLHFSSVFGNWRELKMEDTFFVLRMPRFDCQYFRCDKAVWWRWNWKILKYTISGCFFLISICTEFHVLEQRFRERDELMRRAEPLSRVMCGSVNSHSSEENLDGVEFHSIQNIRQNSTESYAVVEPSQKRRKFWLEEIMGCSSSGNATDEAFRYKSTSIRQFGLDKEMFLLDPLAVLRFWYSRKSTYPKLFKLAMRAYCTTASTTSSERVFSVINKIITPDRSLLSCEHVAKIIVARSLLQYQDS